MTVPKATVVNLDDRELVRGDLIDRLERAEAVDMMKHIATTWDINAEEVFGVKLNAR